MFRPAARVSFVFCCFSVVVSFARRARQGCCFLKGLRSSIQQVNVPGGDSGYGTLQSVEVNEIYRTAARFDCFVKKRPSVFRGVGGDPALEDAIYPIHYAPVSSLCGAHAHDVVKTVRFRGPHEPQNLDVPASRGEPWSPYVPLVARYHPLHELHVTAARGHRAHSLLIARALLLVQPPHDVQAPAPRRGRGRRGVPRKVCLRSQRLQEVEVSPARGLRARARVRRAPALDRPLDDIEMPASSRGGDRARVQRAPRRLKILQNVELPSSRGERGDPRVERQPVRRRPPNPLDGVYERARAQLPRAGDARAREPEELDVVAPRAARPREHTARERVEPLEQFELRA
eukprot:30779-Pelagococcus_subviridis.AAC.8